MKLNVELAPQETAKVVVKEQGSYTYTVKSGKDTASGTVVVSETRDPSGVSVILITEPDEIEAPDPLVIRKNRVLSWTNQRARIAKVTFG